MAVAFDPMLTTNAAGTFNISSAGYVQGVALDDPAIRNELAGGVVALTETQPMFGGVAVSEAIPGTQGYTPNLGPSLIRATNVGAAGTVGAITGFAVFNQAHHGITTPQSTVPLCYPKMTQQFYRLGSMARIPLAIDPALATLIGGVYNQPVSWDYGAQRIVPYVAAYAAATPTSYAYNNGTGALTLTFAAPSGVVTGNDVYLTGFTNPAFNGPYNNATVSGNTLTVQSTPGLAAQTPAGGSLMAGGGVLPIRGIVDINIGNSMVVNYNPVTGFATWNYAGSVAVVVL